MKGVLILDIIPIGDVIYKKGETVRIQGTITKLYTTRGDHKLFTLVSGEESIKGVIFSGSVDLDPMISLGGKKADIIGRIDEYKDELEIIIKEIKLI